MSKDQAETSVEFELIAVRYERRSMLITANQPVGEWGKIFPDQAISSDILQLDLLQIASQKSGRWIDALGFEAADKSLHNVELLGLGSDVRLFVIQQVETEIYRHTPNAQVLSVACAGAPEFEYILQKSDPNSSTAILSTVEVSFPLPIEIENAQSFWQLAVALVYRAEGPYNPNETHDVSMRFGIKSSNQRK